MKRAQSSPAAGTKRSEISFDEDTYAHMTTQAQRQAADTMANILSDAI